MKEDNERNNNYTDAARHISEESRLLLSSLRSGPPIVAHGSLARNLREVRRLVRDKFFLYNSFNDADWMDRNKQQKKVSIESFPIKIASEEDEEECLDNADDDRCISDEEDSSNEDDAGPFVRPFLEVVTDPRAAGPHTLVALQALHRLLERKSLIPGEVIDSKKCSIEEGKYFNVLLEPLLRGVLQCKFEQTNIGADEAVEMTMADLLAVIVSSDFNEEIDAETWRKAFNTVFITRNSFVHSPALCCHLDSVLRTLCKNAFLRNNTDAALKVLEFLIQQLLYTPSFFGEMNPEVQSAHDAINILCLKLTRTCLSTFSKKVPDEIIVIIQDELCLSLLILGQAFWIDGNTFTGGGSRPLKINSAYSTSEVGSTGISLNLLSEVCATVGLLWNKSFLRGHLVKQLEAIFSGFFQRALILLRKRPIPSTNILLNLNLEFDKALEIILDTLLDLLCLFPFDEKNGGSLEKLFFMYDCQMNRSDVVLGLIMELCRCCGVLEEETSFVRQVPVYLKEVCAQILLGALRCLFSNFTVRQNNTSPTNSSLLRSNKQKKLIMKNGALLFNNKSTEGIQYLIEEGVLPSLVTPFSLAQFLRQGLVVGLDKTAVGCYLGDVGKAPIAGQNPANYERDWFHRETLREYCSLFGFENQTILDGLRMFLSCFRLPGEAQQIDRILQAFSEVNSKQNLEALKGYLSSDSKKATDTVYLLSFSIIMLNTDLHNDNIRPEKKMSLDAFVKNNTNYGRDITEEGKEIPEFILQNIYESILQEEIRTEGEGADGIMTVERWKDVSKNQEDFGKDIPMQEYRDLKILVLEHIWQPILNAIKGFWNIQSTEKNPSNARLGIDLAVEITWGFLNLNQISLLQDFFGQICLLTGLFNSFNTERKLESFLKKIGCQSAVIVAAHVAKEMGDHIGLLGWKCICCLLFELRDLKLLTHSFFQESDEYFLSKEARREFYEDLSNKEILENSSRAIRTSRPKSLLGNIGRMFFGVDDGATSLVNNESLLKEEPVHEKDLLIIWDDAASSDNEDEVVEDISIDFFFAETGLNLPLTSSVEPKFESHLIHEEWVYHDDSVHSTENILRDATFSSKRARIRSRLGHFCEFHNTLVLNSRYLSLEGLNHLLQALMEIIYINHSPKLTTEQDYLNQISLSPASEALAEVLLCEISLKNRDRFLLLWNSFLTNHYHQRLGTCCGLEDAEHSSADAEDARKVTSYPGIEKCVTGLLTLCNAMVNREQIANVLLASLKLLYPPICQRKFVYLKMNKQLGIGLWRICCKVDSLQYLQEEGWDALLGLIEWCAMRGCGKIIRTTSGRVGLPKDDPAFNAFQSLYLILHAPELNSHVPFGVVNGIRALIKGGERCRYSKLSEGGLDLLLVLHNRLEDLVHFGGIYNSSGIDKKSIWVNCWLSILDGMAETAETSSFASVRQKALSMLNDAIIDNGKNVSSDHLYTLIDDMCIPLAEKRISALLKTFSNNLNPEEAMIELEVCMRIIFKPFLHFLKNILKNPAKFKVTWQSLLNSMTILFNAADFEEEEEEEYLMTWRELLLTTKELAYEHLRNAVMVLVASNVICSPNQTAQDDLSLLTWDTIENIYFCKDYMKDWKGSFENTLMSDNKLEGNNTSLDMDRNIDCGESSSEI